MGVVKCPKCKEEHEKKLKECPSCGWNRFETGKSEKYAKRAIDRVRGYNDPYARRRRRVKWEGHWESYGRGAFFFSISIILFALLVSIVTEGSDDIAVFLVVVAVFVPLISVYLHR